MQGSNFEFQLAPVGEAVGNIVAAVGVVDNSAEFENIDCIEAEHILVAESVFAKV